ncbi:MAG: hypothetical protein R3F40_13205 [Candidatus Competibacteraceae bacterium]
MDERFHHTTLFRALLRRQLGPDRPFRVEIADDWPPPIADRPAWRARTGRRATGSTVRRPHPKKQTARRAAGSTR